MSCPKLTVREHALITDMEGSYSPYRPETRYVRAEFNQKEKKVAECWCVNAKRFGVKECKTIPANNVYKSYVSHTDAILLSKLHLESEGILTEKHKRLAEELSTYEPKRRKREYELRVRRRKKYHF